MATLSRNRQLGRVGAGNFFAHGSIGGWFFRPARCLVPAEIKLAVLEGAGIALGLTCRFVDCVRPAFANVQGDRRLQADEVPPLRAEADDVETGPDFG